MRNSSGAGTVSMTDRILDMDEIAHSVVSAEGDIALVAERLLGDHRRQSEILDALTADAGAFNAFSTKAKALTLIKSISLLSTLHASFIAQGHELNAKEALGGFVKVADIIATLSETQAPPALNGGNPYEHLMRVLPPHMVIALKDAVNKPKEVAEIERQAPAPAELISHIDLGDSEQEEGE